MKKNKQSGFTLVELAIVLVIIGLLIGGILRGQELLENSRANRTVQQVSSYQAAFLSFRNTYGSYPGDMRLATTRLAGCTIANSCYNGNGNRIIGSMATSPWLDISSALATENTQFWKHLANAHLITGVNPGASSPEWERSHPTASIGGGFFIRYSSFTNMNVPPATVTAHYLVLRKGISGIWDCGNAGAYRGSCTISPRRAAQVDRKADDGIATTGSIIAISASWITGCGRASAGQNGPTGYAEGSDERSCDIMFQIK